MLINEVENIVGLSKKSIRFYEENGLLSPKRKEENGYRIYTEEDIHKLKVIKFLRELDVPIRELNLLNEGKLTLEECLKTRIDKINDLEGKFLKVKKLCEEIINEKLEYNDIDIDKYFINIRVLNKEGFTMHKNKSNNRKKIIGATISTLLFSGIFIFLIFLISYFQFTESENIPWFIYVFLMIILLLPVSAVLYNLVMRIKEILGGEEDEASKY